MHGNGNDFVVIDNLTSIKQISKNQIIQMGDRKKGIGFDQLITINPPKKPQEDLHIRFFNADGSEATMCLNGVRSVGAFVWDADLAPKKELILGTKSHSVRIKPAGLGQVRVMIDMPVQKDILGIDLKFLKKCGVKNYHLIDAGNLHLLLFSANPQKSELTGLCEKLRRSKFFQAINISIYNRKGDTINLRTNEAGAGETLSCGSASAAVASIFAKHSKNTTVVSKGGIIKIRITAKKFEMIGPAAFVCEGTWLKK